MINENWSKSRYTYFAFLELIDSQPQIEYDHMFAYTYLEVRSGHLELGIVYQLSPESNSSSGDIKRFTILVLKMVEAIALALVVFFIS